MKKLLMLVAAVAITSTGFAQKFESGDKNLEVNFTPFGGTPISINNIRFRMFNSESSAIRLGIGVSSNTQKMATGTTTDGKTYMFDTEKTFNFNISPGYEMHFAGTDRLSPYMGAELALEMQKTTIESEYENPGTANSVETTTITGSATTNNDLAYFAFGINLIAGFDYYFADKLYVGSEIGFGFAILNLSDIEVDDTISGFTAPDAQEQGSVTNVSPNFNGAIRLGFCF